MSNEKRALREVIFSHLCELLGSRAEEVAVRSAQLILSNHGKKGLDMLCEFDATLGGYGIFMEQETREMLPGVYRPLSYFAMPLYSPYLAGETRDMVESCGAYLEFLLKRVVRMLPWERIQDGFDRLPLGALVKKLHKHLPLETYKHLRWFSQDIHNQAKHNYHQPNSLDINKHLFDLDEVLACYFIVRKLGHEIEKHSGKSPDIFLERV
jgi:hypothetical protein